MSKEVVFYEDLFGKVHEISIALQWVDFIIRCLHAKGYCVGEESGKIQHLLELRRAS